MNETRTINQPTGGIMYRTLIVAPLITGLLILTPAPAQAGTTAIVGAYICDDPNAVTIWSVAGTGTITASSDPALVGKRLPVSSSATVPAPGTAALSVRVGGVTTVASQRIDSCTPPGTRPPAQKVIQRTCAYRTKFRRVIRTHWVLDTLGLVPAWVPSSSVSEWRVARRQNCAFGGRYDLPEKTVLL